MFHKIYFTISTTCNEDKLTSCSDSVTKGYKLKPSPKKIILF